MNPRNPARAHPARALALAALMASAAALAGCGKTGELQRPGPLNGQGRSTTRAADEQSRQAQDPNRPVDTVDPRDATTDPAPPRTLPIPGSGSDPFAQPPQGALPDPYANPR
jgi:predicted small lipoprotein YifL